MICSLILAQECSDLFSSGGADKLARECGLRFLGKIPLDQVRCKLTACISARLFTLCFVLFLSRTHGWGKEKRSLKYAERVSDMNLVNDLAYHESVCSSLVRAPDRYPGGHGFQSRRDSHFFICPTLATGCTIYPSVGSFVAKLFFLAPVSQTPEQGG